MIASAGSGAGFGGLAGYLEYGRGADDETGARGEARRAERVAWVETRNLPTRDPSAAAEFMAATAGLSARVEKPVYHVSLAFHPDDPVTGRMLCQAADRLLRDLGLSEHQALLVAHKDTAHPHVHLVVNRVHPETGVAWDRGSDYRRIEESIRVQEVELGVMRVKGKHADTPDRARDATYDQARDHGRVGGVSTPPPRTPTAPDAPREGARRPAELDDADRRADRRAAFPYRGPARTHGEVYETRRTGVVPLADFVREHAHLFRGSANWDELTARLGAVGLRLERKGQGLVVSDGVTAVKASRIDRADSMKNLGVRFGETFDEWTVRRLTTPEVAPRSTPAVDPALRTADAPTLTAPDHGTDRGTDRGTSAPVRPVAGRSGGLSWSGGYLAAVLRDYTQAVRIRALLYDARDAQKHAAVVAASAAEAVVRKHAADAALAAALQRVYRDPLAAERAVQAAARQHGGETAALMLRRTPEQFGALHGAPAPGRSLVDRAMDRLSGRARADALTLAYARLERSGAAAALRDWDDVRRRTERRAGTIDDPVRAPAYAARAGARVAALEARAAALGTPAAIAAKVGRVLPRVAPEERAWIEAGLKPEAVGVLRAFEAIGPSHVPAGPRVPGRDVGAWSDPVHRASTVAASYADREAAADVVRSAMGRLSARGLRPELRKSAALGTPSPRLREAIGDAWADRLSQARDPRERPPRELGDRMRALGLSRGGIGGRGGLER